MSDQCACPGLQLNYFLHSSSSHNSMGNQFSTSSVEQLKLLITDGIFCGISASWHVALLCLAEEYFKPWNRECKKSFEAFPQNVERWSWSDGARQTVRRPWTTGNARRPTVESRVSRSTSCKDDNDRRRRRSLLTIRWMWPERCLDALAPDRSADEHREFVTIQLQLE